MKKIYLGILMVTTMTLTACNSIPSNNSEMSVGMPNPASKYCIKQGGKLIPQKNKDGGEYALCQLPNGQTIEEWELFRKDHHQK
ncbi:DUF333 domain-containing protein [Acinetobacter radioresistens]|uniref:DUF333 domain-containing protein n=2 Tax=Moraxellaceae TaxID=468 RepID=A0A8H2JZ83_ACIRA|nr:DUF333 domain-containing protein [Acinetobacter radioresistens]MCK4087924.1 DUF333 domain-containing protein [Acinetobacter radioresistens]MCU4310212.1 DUF333 domain-containing protein [Acinetobacter radioresistens]MCU4568298.1 DUF333 domain-containing protein [Acinetobacter radioresistens]PSD35489.1 DUF333 domain-containing protein [Acinetobacter radioresistens]PSD35786.1 DUF333 domain-containing protein [Acinetobacter radioresistens]